MGNSFILALLQMNSNIFIVLTIVCILLFNSSSYAMNLYSSNEGYLGESNGWNVENVTEHQFEKRHEHGRCVHCRLGLFKCCEPDVCVKHTLGMDKCMRIKAPK